VKPPSGEYPPEHHDMQQKIKNQTFPYRISIDIIFNPGQCLGSTLALLVSTHHLVFTHFFVFAHHVVSARYLVFTQHLVSAQYLVRTDTVEPSSF
jgi:hypothetical protein